VEHVQHRAPVAVALHDDEGLPVGEGELLHPPGELRGGDAGAEGALLFRTIQRSKIPCTF
jgi:hypothetical protein